MSPTSDDATTWDGFYAEDGDTSRWSGRPNPALVAEVTGLAPGRALDVGSGEGADAIWLAAQGWEVTGIEPSGVAVTRARAAASSAGVEVRWIEAGLLDASVAPVDLVTCHYPVLPLAALPVVLDLVASGGTLLLVHHELTHAPDGPHGWDPATHVTPRGAAAELDAAWELQTLEVRARDDHAPDVVLRARRR